MSTAIFSSDREFQMWKYTVGHAQLLLRSVKSAGSPTRSDVVFKGVAELHLPASLRGLRIAEASESEIRILCSLHQPPSLSKDVKVFGVRGVDYFGYVAAVIVMFHEDEGEYDEPSFFAKNNIL